MGQSVWRSISIRNINGSHLTHFLFSTPGRTFPTHPYFQAQLGAGQLSLYNLLKAYSLLDPEVPFNSSSFVFFRFPCGSLSLFLTLPPSLDVLNGTVKCLFSAYALFPLLVCVDVKFVIVAIVGGLLPGPVLHCWSAAVTHGGGGRLQHAQISHV